MDNVIKIKINGEWVSIPAIKGVPGDSYVLTAQDKEEIAEMIDAPVTDVQVGGSSVLNNGVANIPLAGEDSVGVVKPYANYGLSLRTNNRLGVSPATSAQIKAGEHQYKPIVPYTQDQSVFYGLAKLAGVDLASGSDTIGVYPDAAKKAIRKMLGIQNNTWEKIGEYTVSEDTAQFNITTDSNGQPFALSEMYARVSLEPSTTGGNDYCSAYSLIKKTDDTSISSALPTKRWMTNGVKTFMEYTAKLYGNRHVGTGKSSSVPGSTGAVEQISSANNLEAKQIYGLRLSRYGESTSLIPKDTVIELYGIRIDE